MKVKRIEDHFIENDLTGGEMIIQVSDTTDVSDVLQGMVDTNENGIVICVEFIDINHMNKLVDENEGCINVYGDNPIHVSLFTENIPGFISCEMIKYSINRVLDVVNNDIEFLNDDEVDSNHEWYLVIDFSNRNFLSNRQIKEFTYAISNVLEAAGTDIPFNLIYLVKDDYQFDILDISNKVHDGKKKKKKKKKD